MIDHIKLKFEVNFQKLCIHVQNYFLKLFNALVKDFQKIVEKVTGFH